MLVKHGSLLQTISLFPSEDSISNFKSLAGNESSLCYSSCPIPSQTPSDGLFDREGFEEPSEDSIDGLSALSELFNVDSIEIEFTEDCVGEEGRARWDGFKEGTNQRVEVMRLVFQAISDRAGLNNRRKIRKMTLVNLQNAPTPDFAGSDLFRTVTSQLNELHLHHILEHNQDAPDHDHLRKKLLTLLAHL